MLTRPPGGPPGNDLTIWFEGAPIAARASDSVAVALLAGGIVATRSTAISGSPRGPFCMMGACFECLAVVDGTSNVQTCMTPVRDGMRVFRQDGAKQINAKF
ncbi:(2Fe-2S)-binding protein [Rhodopila sp.]|uniref:(2Fe-2S)-binding protein n=1 Tax=Rhodopila sp. TaxID=2480087 RepID=UPI003D12B3CB